MQKGYFSNSTYTVDFFVNLEISQMITILETEYQLQENKTEFLNFLIVTFAKDVNMKSIYPNQKGDRISLWAKLKSYYSNTIIDIANVDDTNTYFISANSLAAVFHSRPHKKTFNDFLKEFSISEQIKIVKTLKVFLEAKMSYKNLEIQLLPFVQTFLNENEIQPNNISKQETHTISQITQPKIFFSYAWGDDKERKGKSREKIVNDLYDSLETEGYKLIRDKIDLGYKGYISDFMKEIGKGDIIIVAVSQKYVKSPFCMFELYEVARNCGLDKYRFREKIVPIMVEFVDFAKPKILEEHFEYWENEYTEWENLVKKRAAQLSNEQLDRYDKIRLVHRNFGMLADWLVDMNTLNPKLLSADNFAIIKAEINKLGK